MLLSFNKTEEGLQTDCEILKVAIQLWLNDIDPTKKDVKSDQLLEFVIQVKEESCIPLKSLLIYLPCKIGTAIDKSDTFLDPSLQKYNETRYTNRFRIEDSTERLIFVDGIKDVKILENKNVLINVSHFNTLSAIRMTFTTPINKGEKVGFRLLLSEVLGIAIYDHTSSTISYFINVYDIPKRLWDLVGDMHIKEDDRIIKAKITHDTERLIGGFDIALYLPPSFYFASNTPKPHEEFLMTLGLLSNDPFTGKERYAGIWRARKIIENKNLLAIGDAISIRGTAENIGHRLSDLEASNKKSKDIAVVALVISIVGIIVGIILYLII